jgi:hypothetical protein
VGHRGYDEAVVNGYAIIECIWLENGLYIHYFIY